MKRAIPALLAAALLLAGCGTARGEPSPPRANGAASPSTVSAAFNSTDVMFAQMLVAYQSQSRKVAPLAAGQATRPELKTLAAAIDATQADEANTLLTWLRAWRQPVVPDAVPSAHAGHGGLPELGDADLANLRKATGPDFDRQFLTLLLGYQHNAVEVARMETAGGLNLDAKELARRVEESRTAEVQQMLQMLNG